eukprot:403339497
MNNLNGNNQGFHNNPNGIFAQTNPISSIKPTPQVGRIANGMGMTPMQQFSGSSLSNPQESGSSSAIDDPTLNQDVIKFLLKLKNNNIQNLKNALKKLGEKTVGNKENLLLRLAKKLATEQGRNLVRQNFKPEVYRQLYEVDINGNYQQIAQQSGINQIIQRGSSQVQGQSVIPPQPQNQQNNRRYLNPTDSQFQGSNMVQNSFTQNYNPSIIPGQSHIPFTQQPQSNGLVMQNGMNQSFQQNSRTQQQNQNRNSVDVIEIDSDTPEKSNSHNNIGQHNTFNNQQNRVYAGVINSQGNDIMSGQEGSSANKSMYSLQYQEIMTQSNYPCILDESNQQNKSQVQCICDNPNSLYYSGSNQQQQQILKTCSNCGKDQHLNCLDDNKNMRTAQQGGQQLYVCHMCQFMQIDPFAIPIFTLLRPFKISKFTTQQIRAKDNKFAREFVFSERHAQEIFKYKNLSDSPLRVQIRCIRLDGVGYEHCFPKFGQLSFNNDNPKNFMIQDPPNDTKKRKDDILDITSMIKRPKNKIEFYQEQKNFDGYFNHPGHVCGIFIVKIIQPYDVINFISTQRIEQAAVSLQRADQFFGKSSNNNDDQDICEIETEMAHQVSISTLCPITRKPINNPARGELCKHLDCFDLETYINMNHKAKRWKCPSCNKRAHVLNIDPYFQKITDLMAKTRQFDPKIYEKIQIDSNLTITIKSSSNDDKEWNYKLTRESSDTYFYDMENVLIIDKSDLRKKLKSDCEDPNNLNQMHSNGNSNSANGNNNCSGSTTASSGSIEGNISSVTTSSRKKEPAEAICLDSDEEMN